MPTDLRNRSTEVKKARKEFVEKFKRLLYNRCEISGRFVERLDCHEFIIKLIKAYDDEVASVILTHIGNVIGIEHRIHLNKAHDYELCQAAVEKRPDWFCLQFGFNSQQQARLDFERKIRGFYQTGQIIVPVSYIPKS